MANCKACGEPLPNEAEFCNKCGQRQGLTPLRTTDSGGAANDATQPGMAENVAGLLCYLVGWITGLIFLLIDKRPFVRFHAAQSLVTFGGLQIVQILCGVLFGAGLIVGGVMGGMGLMLRLLVMWTVGLAALILWIVCMIKAYQHEKFRVPIAAGIADNIIAKS